MKKLIEEYKANIEELSNEVIHFTDAIRIIRKGESTIYDSIEEVANLRKVADEKCQIFKQVIKDIEGCELVKACTVLNEGDGFAHIKDVVTMVSKAGNILEIYANNNGNTSSVSKGLQNIANNINKALSL